MDANQDRREFKFLLTSEVVAPLRRRIVDGLGPELVLSDGYRIRSDYFDTEDRTSYWEKLLGFPNRRRLRLRRYSDSATGRPPACFIEIKHKHLDITVKRRALSDHAELDRFLLGKLPDLSDRGNQALGLELQNMMRPLPWEPVVRIQYDRREYDTGPTGTLRITMDHAVRCCFPNYAASQDLEPNIPMTPEGAAIMEVKTIGAVPYWFRTMMGEFSLIPQAFSKYTQAMERFDPVVNRRRKSA
jgi:hypothetical protein